MGSSKKQRNFMLFRRPRTRAIRGLNNIYVINTLSRNSLASAKEQLTRERGKLDFEVPSVSGERIVTARNRGKILRLLDKAIGRDLITQALVAAVALTENYLADMLRLIFRGYPEKLGGKDKTIDLDLVLAADSLDDVLSAVIERQIHSVFYDRPEKYFSYLDSVLSVCIDEHLKETYAEVKATRDILVHNNGVVNAIYRRKAGKRARASEGELIPIDDAYFDTAIRSMKELIQSVYSQLLGKFGEADVWPPTRRSTGRAVPARPVNSSLAIRQTLSNKRRPPHDSGNHRAGARCRAVHQ